MAISIVGINGINGTNGANPTAGGNGQNAAFTQNGLIGLDSNTINVKGGKGGKGGNKTGVGTGANGGNGGNANITLNGNIFTSMPATNNLRVLANATGGAGGLGGSGTTPGTQGNGGNATVTMNGNILQTSKNMNTIELNARALGGFGTRYGNATATLNGNIIQPTKANNVILKAFAEVNGPDSHLNHGNTAFGTKIATVNGNIVQGNISNVTVIADAGASNSTANINGNIIQLTAASIGIVDVFAQAQHIAITNNKFNLGKQQLNLTISEFAPEYDSVIKNNEFIGTGLNTFVFTDNAAPVPQLVHDTAAINLMTETFVFNGDSNVLKKFANVSVFGNNVDFALTGDNNDNILNGGAGDDFLYGLGGNDQLFGNDGDDFLEGGTGDDLLDGGNHVLGDTASFADGISGVTVNLNIVGPQAVGGGLGNDTLVNIEHLLGSAFNDNLTGDGNANILTGGLGNDFLIGGGGNDTLNGGDDDDALQGGTGDDVLNGGNGIDLADYSDATVDGLLVNLLTGTSSGGGLGNDTLTGIENVYGSNFNDRLIGDGNSNALYGGGGYDILRGGAGNDYIDGGALGDVAHFAGRESQYTTATLASVTGGPDGDDTLISIERIKFLSPTHVSDVDNNGYGDLVYQNAANGNLQIRTLSAGPTVINATVTGIGGVAWKAIATGQFTADTNRNAGVLLQNDGSVNPLLRGNLEIVTAISGATVPVQLAVQPGAGWIAKDVGDFNGDATSDVLLQNDGSVNILDLGKTEIMFLGGTPGSVIATHLITTPVGYTAVSSGDFNGDGFSDVLWSDGVSVQVSLMYDQTTILNSGALATAPGMVAIGTGDFDGDGNSDILFQSSPTEATIWTMNGTNQTSTIGPISQPVVGVWTVQGAADVDNNGVSDIIWRETAGIGSRATLMAPGGGVLNANFNLGNAAATLTMIASTGGG